MALVTFFCATCGVETPTTKSDYDRRVRSSIGNVLYCSRKCSASRNVVSRQDDGTFRRGLMTPEMFGGLNKFNVQGDTMAMAKSTFTLSDLIAQDPTIFNKQAQYLEDGNIMVLLTGGAAAQPVPAPIVAPVVTQPQAPVIPQQQTPTVPTNRPVIQNAPVSVDDLHAWKKIFSQEVALSNECDAEPLFSNGNFVGRSCAYNEATQKHHWCYIDRANSVYTMHQVRTCFRCQGKGWISEQNGAYNMESDIKYNKWTTSPIDCGNFNEFSEAYLSLTSEQKVALAKQYITERYLSQPSPVVQQQVVQQQVELDSSEPPF